jgi:hypothetical protein
MDREIILDARPYGPISLGGVLCTVATAAVAAVAAVIKVVAVVVITVAITA